MIYTFPTTYCPEDVFPEPSPIELLGYAKNDIVEARQYLCTLPAGLSNKLHAVYEVLTEIQEYLYNDPLVS